MLELKKIRKSYRIGDTHQLVLKDIDIKFRENEFTSILGSSGSGKTTLLNIIGGLDRYDSGELIIDNVSTKEYKDRDWDSYRNYRVGFIFQSYNLIMHQSVLQNVEIALTLSGIGKNERRKRAVEAITRVGLKDHIDKRPNQLSGGQMQRVAIARALVNDPEIILADEPTGALDTKTSIQIMDLLKEIAKDKLVIMVTHNPELAKKYSTRIIKLQDGNIISDSNPFKGKEKVNEKIVNKTSMSLKTALTLSLNNLMTKKGRTFLTAFAGSIGIIGISLIMSLSNGVNNYAKQLEKDSLSDYPIKIEKVSYDLFGSLSASLSESANKKECEKGKICSNDDVVKESVISSDKGLLQKNNTKEFKKYVNSKETEFKKYSASIEDGYDVELQVYTKDYNKVNPTDLTSKETNIFTEINMSGKKYKVLAGKLPENSNELVVIVGDNREIDDSILYSLNIVDRNNLMQDLEKISKNDKYRVSSKTYSYDDFLNREYKLILNTDYYKKENGRYADYSNNQDYMKNKIDKGTDLKIVGVVQDKDLSTSTIGYTHDLTLNLIREISNTSIYEDQMNNKDTNVLTGASFDGINDTYDNLVKKLGIYSEDDPSYISFYPKDYKSKEKITKLIDKYNKEKKANKEKDLVITYNDTMKTIVNSITSIVDIISMVLIALVAISLIVSSIMIAIITYISVLERTKEIGILRAIGASKKDIKRVFRAETIIEGFISGVMGIAITMLLNSGINTVVAALSKVDAIANMPILSAVLLILLSVLLNVIAGMKPARIAAKKDPVEALRTE